MLRVRKCAVRRHTGGKEGCGAFYGLFAVVCVLCSCRMRLFTIRILSQVGSSVASSRGCGQDCSEVCGSCEGEACDALLLLPRVPHGFVVEVRVASVLAPALLAR